MPRVDRHSFKLRNPSYNPHLGIRGLVVMTSLGARAPNKAIPGKCIIRHDSIFKAVWDWVILVFVIYTAFEIPFSATFLLPQELSRMKSSSRFAALVSGSPLAICNLCVDLLFVVDIPINFRSTYVREGTDELIVNPKKIALNYFKSWFLIDLLSAIPFEFMVDHRKDGATTLMGLLKTARLLRLVRIVRKFDRYSEYGQAVIILLTCFFLLVAHWLACIWHAIGQAQLGDHNSWIEKLSRHSQHVSSGNVTHTPGLQTRYITALYFTMTSLSSVGFGNVSPNTNAEKVFSILVMIVGALMYASIFGNMTAIIQRLYSRTSRHRRNLRIIQDFVRFYKIPRNLRDDLEEYFRHEWSYTKGMDIDTVLKRFPESLQADICVHLHKKLFAECSAFQCASEGCLRALARRFDIRRHLPGQYLIKQGDEVKKLYFIAKGFVEVLKDGHCELVLGKGDVISCDYTSRQSLRTAKANASLLIQTYCQIHVVDWQDLLSVLRVYSKFRESFTNHLKLAYNLDDSEIESPLYPPLNQHVYNPEHIEIGYNNRPDCSIVSIETKLDSLERKLEDFDKRFTEMMSNVLPLVKRLTDGPECTDSPRDTGTRHIAEINHVAK
ncbi:potassium voltage-gated channel subfamily H member 6 isoform X2 [Nematostella vectensis]|uniref:potassium voltage-gated channel subfamily H member 6 isoform X2 n=1 Tax=Nematostella vectensis TaxID=45351 RepID=UPI002076E493|nr:potassium voltage-gated channel subfamily H member 6 isoform X2 [Nematostella vectensis]